jgi:hypothetical protein
MSFTDPDLQRLIMRGGRLGGPEPQGGISADKPLAPAAVVEVDRKASKDGIVSLGQVPVVLGPDLIGKPVTLRFDGSMLYVIHAGVLVKTLPAPIPHQQRAKLTGARTATTPCLRRRHSRGRPCGISAQTGPSRWHGRNSAPASRTPARP